MDSEGWYGLGKTSNDEGESGRLSWACIWRRAASFRARVGILSSDKCNAIKYRSVPRPSEIPRCREMEIVHIEVE